MACAIHWTLGCGTGYKSFEQHRYGAQHESGAATNLQEAQACWKSRREQWRVQHSTDTFRPMSSRHTASMSPHFWASSNMLPVAYAMMEARMNYACPRPLPAGGEDPAALPRAVGTVAVLYGPGGAPDRTCVGGTPPGAGRAHGRAHAARRWMRGPLPSTEDGQSGGGSVAIRYTGCNRHGRGLQIRS